MGNDSVASAAGSHTRHRLFGQATPGPAITPTALAGTPGSEGQDKDGQKTPQSLLTQRGFDMRG
jgi:hypothetical protein